MKSPGQELYDKVFEASEELNYDTYQINPERDTPYPFVQIGDVQLIPISTKSYLLGRLSIVVDVWGDEYSRKTVTTMAQKLTNAMSKIRKLPSGLSVSMQFNATSVEERPEQADNEDLWRARIMTEYTLR